LSGVFCPDADVPLKQKPIKAFSCVAVRYIPPSVVSVLCVVGEPSIKKLPAESLVVDRIYPVPAVDASVVVPLIKEYLEISVKNDDALIKLAAIVQRLMKDNNNEGGGLLLSDEEKRQLMDAIDEVEKDLPVKGDEDE
jgi:hypothetical protein